MISRITREFRRLQFEKINEPYVEYKTKVKFIKPNGETHWMDITNEELDEIKKILTERKV
jgi:hypothetical protein